MYPKGQKLADLIFSPHNTLVSDLQVKGHKPKHEKIQALSLFFNINLKGCKNE